PPPKTMAALGGYGAEALRMLRAEKATRLLTARARLLREARRLRLRGHFYFLAPRHFSLAEYVAARTVGGRPVDGAIRMRVGQPLPRDDELRAGAIAVVTGSSPATLRRVVSRLLAAGL